MPDLADGWASGWSGLLAVLVLAAVSLAGAHWAHRMTSVAPGVITSWPWLSGWDPSEHALSRFHARWYPATVVFLAFDVEMLFMYPWVLVVADVGLSAVVEMFVFLGVLLLAVLWASREGAFEWQ
ncbi:NADH-quinone oxidoreductase subunit A [uncultured Pseudokineococcus sp.]|uniref:NADH-quinone oxidoreductase subunit A n=1 Tax=uncultured Pseudokineococcus sp. TaxID=1642928 RepID=UPI00262E309D|nr:NADH-quinone oxidoreductase subunit A [uncultured Pseudokineococcus sp.]